MDKEAMISEVRYLYGNRGRRCGRHKREGECALPGEISRRASGLGRKCYRMRRRIGMRREKSAEGIVGRSTRPKART
jgi:hypothetical protein